MESSKFELRSLDIERDALKLAKMWNDSDDQWPCSFNNGVPFTDVTVKEWLENEDMQDTMIWDTGEEIAGFCSWSKNLKEPDVYYIPLLNVAPKYQNHSLARKILVHYIDRTVKAGGKRLDLHTWSGNLKAVPLYKKCGFRWLPKTQVFMLNFMPWILNEPVCKDFFDRNYWYSVHSCLLNQEEDDEKIADTNVFSYKFIGNDETIITWFDRESRSLIGIETSDYKIISIPKTLKPIKGIKTSIKLEIENKTNDYLPVTVITDSDNDFNTSFKRTINSNDNCTTSEFIDVEVKSVFPDIKYIDTAKAVHSNIIVQNQLIEFANGLRPIEALQINTYPDFITVHPNKLLKFILQVKNPTDFDIEYEITFAKSTDYAIEVDITSCKVEANSYAIHNLELITKSDDSFNIPYCINLNIGDKELLISNKSIAVLVKPIGGVGVVKDNDGLIRVENESIRAILPPKRLCKFYELQTGKVITHSAILAPPSFPNIFNAIPWSLSAKKVDGSVEITAFAIDKDNPCWSITKTMIFNASTIVEVKFKVTNLSEVDGKKYIQQSMSFDYFEGDMVLPLDAGIVKDDCVNFPGGPDDSTKKIKYLKENWMMLDGKYFGIGIIIPNDIEEGGIDWDGLYLKQEEIKICAGEVYNSPSTYLYLKPNSLKEVRDVYLKNNTNHSRVYDKNPVIIDSYLTTLVEPKVITCNEEMDKVWLSVNNFTARKLSGKVSLEPDDPDAYISQKHIDFTDVNYSNPLSSELTIKSNADEVKPIRVNVTIDTSEKTYHSHFNIIKIAKPGKVLIDQLEREGMEIHKISNGLLDIELSPDFAGSVTSVKYRGEEQIFSSFPKASAYSWLSPWYGGIMPVLYDYINDPNNENTYLYPGRLYKEKFGAEISGLIDKQQNRWQGVLHSVYIQDESCKDLEYSLGVYTLPFSNVIKLTVSVMNNAPIHRRIFSGYSSYPQPNGNNKKSVILAENHEQRPTPIGKWRECGNWIVSMDPESKMCVGFTSNSYSFTQSGWGLDGNFIDFIALIDLLPEKATKFHSYIYITQKPKEIEQYNELRYLL